VSAVAVLRSADAVRERLGSLPGPVFGHLDAEVDVFLAVVDALPEAQRPHVVVTERPGAAPAALVARLEERVLPARFGYATLFKPRLRCLTVVSGGATGAPADQAALVRELMGSLARREADVLVFHRAPAPSWRRYRVAAATPHWVMDLPADGALLPALPKRLRDNYKRSRKLVTKAFGDGAEIRRLDRPEHLETILADLEAVAARTYQRGLGAGFDATRDRDHVALGLEQGWFRAWVLYTDGAPRAFELGYLHGDRFIIGAKGFDPEYGRHEVGTALQLHLLEELCADPQVRTVDFGFGDADYKRRLANRHWDEVDLLIYGSGPRALAANLGRSAILGADRLARRAAGQDRIARVKRRWRALRTPAGQAPPGAKPAEATTP
jgi:CelD/BcsL family acetyltransferase involved in cellulose biosynthesis